MATDVVEEELLRSIEDVEARIKAFRQRVRTVLAQTKDQKAEQDPQSQTEE